MFIQDILANPDSALGHCHCPSLAIAPSGDLLVCWYAYPEEETRGGVLFLARRRVGAQGFDPPRRILAQLSSSLGNPVLFFGQAQRLHLLFVSLRGRYWDSAALHACWSDDLGATWSTPDSLRMPDGLMVRHPPIVRRNGYLLLPAYDEMASRTVFLSAGPDATGWMEVDRLEGAAIQGSLVRQGPEQLALLLRPVGDHRICLRAISADDGRSWSPVVRTPLPNPLSGVAAFEGGGCLCAVYNHTSAHQRYPLSLSWSADRGTSWSGPIHVDETPREVSYPSFAVDGHGTAHGAYTFGRTRIRYVSFDRSWWMRERPAGQGA
jgi:predicted neuraminidase